MTIIPPRHHTTPPSVLSNSHYANNHHANNHHAGRCHNRYSTYFLMMILYLMAGVALLTATQALADDGNETTYAKEQPENELYQVHLHSPSILERVNRFKKETGTMPGLVMMKSWRQQLEAEQADVIIQLPANIHMIEQYFNSDNALTVAATSRRDLIAVEKLSQVERISRHTTLSSQISLAKKAVFSLPNQLPQKNRDGEELVPTGSGVRVGILDSGINYTHMTFGGSGLFENNDASTLDDLALPSPTKVAGGYDFISRDKDFGGADINWHGTAVGSVVAGLGVFSNGPAGYYTVDNGIAPDAILYGLRVLDTQGNGSTANLIRGIEWSLDPNGDGLFDDALDIINVSVGANNFKTSSIGDSLQAAVQFGLASILSAGNDGNMYYNLNAYFRTDNAEATSVAASDSKLILEGYFENQQSEAIPLSVAPLDIFFPEYTDQPVTFETAILNVDEQCNVLNSNEELADRLVFISVAILNHGKGCDIDGLINKTRFRPNIIVIHGANNFLTSALLPIDFLIPTFLLPKSFSWENIIEDVAGELSFTLGFDTLKLQETIADYSSIGPSFSRNTFSPSLSAPGTQILMATNSDRFTKIGLDRLPNTAATIANGTSFSAPLVAGATALLKEIYPNFGHTELQALLMNYTDPLNDENGIPYPTIRQGTGRMNVAKSLSAKAYATPPGIDFDEIEILSDIEIIREITVTNFSDTTLDYEITFEQGQTLQGFSLWHPQRLSVPANGKASFIIRLRGRASDMSLLTRKDIHLFDGWLALNATNEPTLRVAFQSVVVPSSSIKPHRTGAQSILVTNNTHVGGEYSVFPAMTPLYLPEDTTDLSRSELPFTMGLSVDPQTLEIRMGIELQDGNFWNTPLPLNFDLAFDFDNDYIYDVYVKIADEKRFEKYKKDEVGFDYEFKNLKGKLVVIVDEQYFRIENDAENQRIATEASDFILAELEKVRGELAEDAQEELSNEAFIKEFYTSYSRALRYVNQATKDGLLTNVDSLEIQAELARLSNEYTARATVISEESRMLAFDTLDQNSINISYNSRSLTLSLGREIGQYVTPETTVNYYTEDLSSELYDASFGDQQVSPNFKVALPFRKTLESHSEDRFKVKFSEKNSFEMGSKRPMLLISPTNPLQDEGVIF